MFNNVGKGKTFFDDFDDFDGVDLSNIEFSDLATGLVKDMENTLDMLTKHVKKLRTAVSSKDVKKMLGVFDETFGGIDMGAIELQHLVNSLDRAWRIRQID